nr:hypothetical protein Iba_chr13dCG6230 [Ipomoea batatas]
MELLRKRLCQGIEYVSAGVIGSDFAIIFPCINYFVSLSEPYPVKSLLEVAIQTLTNHEIMLPVVNSMVSRTGINGEAVSTIHYLLRTARLNHS